jgi:hypothetical protein
MSIIIEMLHKGYYYYSYYYYLDIHLLLLPPSRSIKISDMGLAKKLDKDQSSFTASGGAHTTRHDTTRHTYATHTTHTRHTQP